MQSKLSALKRRLRLLEEQAMTTIPHLRLLPGEVLLDQQARARRYDRWSAELKWICDERLHLNAETLTESKEQRMFVAANLVPAILFAPEDVAEQAAQTVHELQQHNDRDSWPEDLELAPALEAYFETEPLERHSPILEIEKSDPSLYRHLCHSWNHYQTPSKISKRKPLAGAVGGLASKANQPSVSEEDAARV